jgi:mono/diheme cytochrome c family protein
MGAKRRIMIAAGVMMLVAITVPALPRAQASEFPYDVMTTVVLPKGDVAAGRQAFLDLKCHTCHRVTAEPRLPPPVADARGPDLDATLQRQDASALAAAIIAPSHAFSVRTSAELRERLRREAVSPMGDFSRVMTVRQLADVLAYLKSVR